MKKIFLLSVVMITICISSFSQGVGIGTNSPDSSAALDVSSTSKGYLYPRMTTAQRNAIVNPADGLHIFNTDTDAPEYYSSKIKTWICLGAMCTQKILNITISGTQTNSIVIKHGTYGIDTNVSDSPTIIVTVTNGSLISSGIVFSNLNQNTNIILFNYGTIHGKGGKGGDGGGQTLDASYCSAQKVSGGGNGGDGISLAYNITIHNYGKIYGGGGGGAGGPIGITNTLNGGGGGSGIGSNPLSNQDDPGKGGVTSGPNQFFICTETPNSKAADGTEGNEVSAGIGGLGSNSNINLKGGDGGIWGQPGKDTRAAKGGKGGNAIKNTFAGKTKIISYPGSSILGQVSN